MSSINETHLGAFDICCFNIAVLLWMLTQLLQQPDKITRRINWAFILSITGEFEHLEPSLHVPHSTIEDYPQYLHLIRSSNHGSKPKIPTVLARWWRKYCFSESFPEVGFDYQYWLWDWKMAADKPVHRHSQLVGAKLILLTLLDTILHGNNQFRDVSTFLLHTTSLTRMRTII